MTHPYVVLDVVVPGNPQPKERPRHGSGSTYTGSKTVAAELMIATIGKRHVTQAADVPVSLTVHFKRSDKRGADIDNLVKTVQDALNKIAYTDDKLVLLLHATVTRGVPEEEASTHIRIETLPADSPLLPAKRARKVVK